VFGDKYYSDLDDDFFYVKKYNIYNDLLNFTDKHNVIIDEHDMYEIIKKIKNNPEIKYSIITEEIHYRADYNHEDFLRKKQNLESYELITKEIDSLIKINSLDTIYFTYFNYNYLINIPNQIKNIFIGCCYHWGSKEKILYLHNYGGFDFEFASYDCDFNYINDILSHGSIYKCIYEKNLFARPVFCDISKSGDLYEPSNYDNNCNLDINHCNTSLPLELENLFISNIYFDIDLNKLLDQCKKIKSIQVVSENFNKSLSNLPNSINSININSNNFDQQLLNLPLELVFLNIVSLKFNYPVNDLPKNLQILSVKSQLFNQELLNLPPTLKLLNIISFHFDKPLYNLPTSLQILNIESNKISDNLNFLPESLKYLKIHNYNDNKVKFDKNNLPIGIKKLIINYKDIKII
jgi:hypothetical protein